MFGAILKTTNSSFQKGMTFCRSIYVKKVMKLLAFIFEQSSFNTYNQATSNLALYSHETSQDKLSEAPNRQSIIAIQVQDKLHEKLFISTCSFL